MFHCLCCALKEQLAHDTLKEIRLLRCLGSRGELTHSIHLSIHLFTHPPTSLEPLLSSNGFAPISLSEYRGWAGECYGQDFSPLADGHSSVT